MYSQYSYLSPFFDSQKDIIKEVVFGSLIEFETIFTIDEFIQNGLVTNYKQLNATECRLEGKNIIIFIYGHYHFGQNAKTFYTKGKIALKMS